MSAYIPLIKTTRWIDLSPDHKNLRKELEQDTLKASVNKEQIQPIMLQGAFGIGKTNSLYYIFHYGWCKLKTPTFLISLDEITKAVKEFALKQPTGKIQNDQLGPFINKLLLNQIEALKGEDWSSLERIFFPEFNAGDLNKYLKDFKQVEVIEDSKAHLIFDNTFSKSVILEAVNTSHRPILLIDEFESKFYELKKYIETSGGGVLRELFDQIVQDTNLFYLIIGNGPASGYEIAKERGDNNSDSETAANRRLKTKPIPFPTSNLLQRSFLKNDPKGYINFIWWLSRCRPGHIMKLRDSLGQFEDLATLSFSELITKTIFNEPIDDGGEAVTYLKTDFFNQFPGRTKSKYLAKELISFAPNSFELDETDKTDLRECVNLFYCNSKLLNADQDILPELQKDIYNDKLLKYQEEGNYTHVDYAKHIEPFFSFILSGIADENGQIGFGMINDNKPDEVLSNTFLLPLLELTYDFISLYQDDSIKETRETLDFILKIFDQITKSIDEGNIDVLMSNTFDIFDKCKLTRNNKVFLQLSLYAIRESIEQPIGSPKLKYKNEQASALLADVNLKEALPLIFHKEENFYNYFIPALSNEILDKYLEDLQKHLYANFYDKFHKDGDIVIRVIYFDKNEKIDDFRTNLLYKDGDSNHPKAIYSLNKIDVVDLESYQLNFGGQIRDYIDSVSQIGIIGVSSREPAILTLVKDESILNLKDIIKVIGDRPWTEKKETIRTIEHYRKLLFDGDNSTFKSIHKIANAEYKTKLEENICKQDDFRSNVWEYSFLEKLIKDESESYDSFTIDVALLYLFENKSIDDNIRQLLELCKNDFKFDADKENVAKAVNFKNLLSILTKNKKELESHSINFDLSSSFISKLTKLTDSLIYEDEINNIDEYFSFLSSKQENGFIKSYHNVLGGYLLPELTDTLYSLNYLKTLSIEDVINRITKELYELESNFSEVRVKIVTKLDELKTILDESQNLSAYPENLNKALKGITLIKKVLTNEPTYSTSLIIFSVIQHLSKVAKDAKLFNEQLDEIFDDVSTQKEKIDLIQEEIDKLYEDSLTKKLIGFEFPIPRNNGYLWKKRYLKDKLKESEEYEKLFGDTKNCYNPFTRPTIYPDKIEKFYKALVTITNNLNGEFNEMVSKMRAIKNSAESITQIQNFINQLLTPIEE
ncbi:hypothetical protein [Shivajiella indica]|uniref:ATP-binding protein n=1 Tax=Shivajiella indica TaxID=872115 RepID=A0ABW5BBD0_9BACT